MLKKQKPLQHLNLATRALAIVFGLLGIFFIVASLMLAFNQPPQNTGAIYTYNVLTDLFELLNGLIIVFAATQIWEKRRWGFWGVLLLPIVNLISSLGLAIVIRFQLGQIDFSQVWPNVLRLVIYALPVCLIYRHYRPSLQQLSQPGRYIIGVFFTLVMLAGLLLVLSPELGIIQLAY
jgi:hypothetical protein